MFRKMQIVAFDENRKKMFSQMVEAELPLVHDSQVGRQWMKNKKQILDKHISVIELPSIQNVSSIPPMDSIVMDSILMQSMSASDRIEKYLDKLGNRK